MNGLMNNVKDWILQFFPQNARIVSIYPLKGSTTASLFEITIEISDKQKEHVVLRQYDKPDAVEKSKAISWVENEANSLIVAYSLRCSSPKFIGKDKYGEVSGYPLLLMSKLPGKVDLHPITITAWLENLAITLKDIHQNRLKDFSSKHFRYHHPDNLNIPVWSSHPEVWGVLFQLAKQQEPMYDPIFIHRDFHPVNVLWQGEEVTGVVDWANGCLGHAGIDVGHCRWNLAMIYGVDEADLFLEYYIKHAENRFSYDVYWDNVSLMDVLMDQPSVYPGWTEFGRKEITKEILIDRIDQYAISLYNRIKQ
ncbi:aminoglycoside phosphotransferase family protein [Oceanobacillus sp. 1P07AA]|uniref:aminoglycoside phosphotransferase family protein n=1 Tax=Oceanobacillus sp. 1P07AA TaxID=3132293 RepID=UPI0039A67458